MYTAYMILAIVLVVSFFTGNVVLIAEHKQKNKKLSFKQGIIIDEDVL